MTPIVATRVTLPRSTRIAILLAGHLTPAGGPKVREPAFCRSRKRFCRSSSHFLNCSCTSRPPLSSLPPPLSLPGPRLISGEVAGGSVGGRVVGGSVVAGMLTVIAGRGLEVPLSELQHAPAAPPP